MDVKKDRKKESGALQSKVCRITTSSQIQLSFVVMSIRNQKDKEKNSQKQEHTR